MSIRKYKTKNSSSWQAVITTPQGQFTRCFSRKLDAQDFERETRFRLRFGEPVEPIEKRPEMTVGSLFDEWCNRYAESRKTRSSVMTDIQIFRSHLEPEFGKAFLRDVTARQVESVMSVWKRAGLAPKTINNILGLLKKVLTDAVRWGHLESNPIAWVKSFPLPARDFHFWTKEQAQKFLDHVHATAPDHALCFHIALHTGMRLGEIRGLLWSEIDFKRNHIVVRRVFCSKSNAVRETTKSNKIRYQPVTHSLRCQFEQRARSAGSVIENFDWSHASKFVRRYAIQCGLPPIRFHDLRHSYASILAMDGVSLYKVKSLMGHSSYAMTERYAHLAKETLHDAVNQSLERLV